MKLLCGVLLFIGVFTLNNASSVTTLKRIATDQMLMQHLMRATTNNPSFAVQCFNLYVPIYDAILQEFSTAYQLCVTTAQSEINELNKEAAANQTLISTSAQDVCNSMIACSALESLEFFDCYAQKGDGNIKSLYGLTNTAIDVAAYLREEYQIVENNMVKCQNASERAYVEATTTTTEALNYCLANGPPEFVTTTAAPVVTTTIIDITTPLPTTIEETKTTEVTIQPDENELPEEDLSRSVPLTFLNKYKRA